VYEDWSNGEARDSTVPTFSGNDEFTLGVVPADLTLFSVFTKTPSGVLQADGDFTEVDPAGNPDGGWSYDPLTATADPTII
jgi:hypothetical protein